MSAPISRKQYAIAALVLFITEALIARYVHDQFIRPKFGDFLVVILVYCFVRAVTKLSVIPAAIGALIFSYVVEITQYFHLIRHLGLEHSTLAHLILGSSFSWSDMLAYTLGIGVVLLLEASRQPKSQLA